MDAALGDPQAQRQVISLHLTQAEDMFQLPAADLFSEYRNFLTGVDYCISELRSHRSRRPVRVELVLPAAEVDDTTGEKVRRTLARYCDHRIAYNGRERRASRFDGISSLRVGIPLAILGLLAVFVAARIAGRGGNGNLVFDTVGWVLVWVGLWFPLDTMLFTPLGYGRENRRLVLLRDAEVAVTRHPTAPLAERAGESQT